MDDHAALFVVVSGAPGSGKSTIAPGLATRMGLPLLAKDTIKEALLSVLAPSDVEMSRRLGQAAIGTMFAVAGESARGAVLEGTFHRTPAARDIGRLPGRVIEVFCRCDRSTASQRFRARSASRHPGHFDGARADGDIWNDEVARPVAGGWSVLHVDTDRPVDIGALAAEIGRIVAG